MSAQLKKGYLRLDFGSMSCSYDTPVRTDMFFWDGDDIMAHVSGAKVTHLFWSSIKYHRIIF